MAVFHTAPFHTIFPVESNFIVGVEKKTQPKHTGPLGREEE